MTMAGGNFARLLRSTDDDSPGELLIYDRRGVCRYCRLDELKDPHDILWDGDNFVAVSSLTNSILWLSRAGEVVRQWKAEAEGDAWHLNSLLLHDGALLFSAFGEYQHHREWCDHPDEPTGFVWNFSGQRPVLRGLAHPHHPRFFDGAWAVCNSHTEEILQIDPSDGEIRRRVRLGGYTRGFAVSENLIFVGESANRKGGAQDATASVAILSRSDWRLLDRVALPCREVYDVVLVPDENLLEGIRQGFRTNSTRVSEQDQYDLFRSVGIKPALLWAVSEPLPEGACRIRIEAAGTGELPLPAGRGTRLKCRVENLGGAILHSAPPYPVHLSYKWLDPSTGAWNRELEGVRTKLDRPLTPGSNRTIDLDVRTPDTPGEYLLRVTAVQEHVRWFDDADPANACSIVVRVFDQREADCSGAGSTDTSCE